MPVSGALTQIAAQGPQNRFLTIDPQITFFKGSYRRHSMFAMVEIENTFSGAVGPGKKLTSTIARSGDLIAQMYFYTELSPIVYNNGFTPDPENFAYYTNSIGHALIEHVSVEIGGNTFDEQSGEFLEIWERLSSSASKRLGEMIGYSESTGQLAEWAKKTQFLYVPFRFWFNRDYSQALPLIALQYHEVKINLRTKSLDQCIVKVGEAAGPASGVPNAQPGTADNMLLLVNYIFLDNLERRMFAQQSHEYLIDEVQYTGSDPHTGGSSQSIRLQFNHPVKELLWVCQRQDVVEPDPFVAASGATPASGGGGNDLFNFSGQMDNASSVVYDPFLSAELQLNGHARTLDHQAIYYRTVQPWQHHTAVPNSFIYVYSFALFPEDSKQPSGSCNFSRIDNVTLRFTFPTALTADTPAQAQPWTGQIRCYALSMNVVKITSGMAGKMYAN